MILKEKFETMFIGTAYYATAPLMGSLSPKVREKIYYNLSGKERPDQETYNMCYHGFPFWTSVIASPVMYFYLARLASDLTNGNSYAIGGTLIYGLLETAGRAIKNLEEVKTMESLWDARKGTPANLPGKIIGDSIDAVISLFKKKQ